MSAPCAGLPKKGLKSRFCNQKNDLTKLRDDLRQRCKLRMRQERDDLRDRRRFVNSFENDVNNKINEIFHTELTDLSEKYDVPSGTADNVKKIIENEQPAKTIEEKEIVEEYHTIKEEGTTILHEES